MMKIAKLTAKQQKHQKGFVIATFIALVILILALAFALISTIGQKDKRVAVIMDTIGNEQFLIQAADRAKELAQIQDFDLSIMESVSAEHWEYNTRKASKDGFDLIIGVGWQAAEQFALASKENPDIQYAIIDAKSGSLNVKSVEFNEGEGAYVLGVMIGSAFKNEKKIGYISSFKSQGTYKYRYQFEQGVLSVNPNMEILYEYTNSYSDKKAAYNKAMSLKKEGVNFIMGGVSSSANEGIYEAALECAEDGNPFYTTGLSIDQTSIDNPYIIGGLTKNTAVATECIINEFLSKHFEKNINTLGLKENAMGVVHVTTRTSNYINTDIMTDEVITKAKDIVDDIISGEIIIMTPEEQ